MTIEEAIQLREDLRHLKDEVHDTKVMVKNLDHSIRGNGKPGLLQRVSILEVAQKNRVQMLTLLASLGAAVAAIVSLFK